VRRGELATSTLLVAPSLPRRLFGRLVGRPVEGPQYAVRIPEIDLRRSGHITTGTAESAQTREEFRAIKRNVVANLANASGARDPRVILVTSTRPGEGKTFVALNLALSLTVDRDMSVTLIDADPIDHGLSRRLGITEERGLFDGLGQGTTEGQSTNVSNLTVIPAGRSRSDAPELLSSERMGRLLESLTNSGSSLVILDSSALLSGSSAAALSGFAGQTLFVIGCRETGRQLVDEALTLLDSQIGPLESANIGLVLNKISPDQSAARFSGTTA